MPRRALLGLIVALAAGALIGNGLAGLSSPLPNDACLDPGSLPEGSTSGGSVELWPLGRQWEYHVRSRLAPTTHFGPTTAELYAGIVAVTLLAGLALLRRDSAVVRGAAPRQPCWGWSGRAGITPGSSSRSGARSSRACRSPSPSITFCRRAACARPAARWCSQSRSCR